MESSDRWARCCKCGNEVWFDAWVDLNGQLAGGPYSYTFCPTCEGKADYEIVSKPKGA